MKYDYIMRDRTGEHYRIKTASDQDWVHYLMNDVWVSVKPVKDKDQWLFQNAAIYYKDRHDWEFGVEFDGYWPSVDSPHW